LNERARKLIPRQEGFNRFEVNLAYKKTLQKKKKVAQKPTSLHNLRGFTFSIHSYFPIRSTCTTHVMHVMKKGKFFLEAQNIGDVQRGIRDPILLISFAKLTGKSDAVENQSCANII